jgi:hypothetical protein
MSIELDQQYARIESIDTAMMVSRRATNPQRR